MATPKRKVLFLTNSEYGQTNVVVGTVHELLQHPAVDIHIASFAPFQARCEALLAWHARAGIAQATSSLTFHTIPGQSMFQIHFAREGRAFMNHPPTFTGVLQAVKKVPAFLSPWEPPEYIRGFEACMGVIGEVAPDVIVVDMLFNQGIDACKALGKRWVVLTPSTLRELVPQLQPVTEMFFKYPALGSNYPYPLPWSKVLPNLYLQFAIIINMVTNPRLRELGKYRNEHGAPGMFPTYEPYNEKCHYLTSTLRSIDYEYSIIPSNITFCGPIVSASPPVDEFDADLAKWLVQRPTVLINLGTVSGYSTESASRFARALRKFLLRNTRVQVLWKIEGGGEIVQALVEEMSGRLRVVEWLEPEVSVVLETGNFVLSIHHGGANSFFETVRAGIPAIILPAWLDCYAFATIAEHYGCGIFANRDSAPDVDEEGLSTALLRILGDDETPGEASFAERARALGEEAKLAGGRVVASKKILEFADSGEWA